MPKIISVGTSVPPYEISQEKAKEFAQKMFQPFFKDIDRLLKIFDHTHIEKRYFCVPDDWFQSPHTLEEKNSIYIENAIQLAKSAILSALTASPFSAEEIDHIVFVSSTGISTPSIDAHLFNDPELAFQPHIKRTPIWGLGCAGGAAGLSRAFEYTLAFPKAKVLVVSVEIGELAFLNHDFSKSNLVATSLFGDGAAAVLIIGDEAGIDRQKHGIEIINTQSTIWDDSLDVMGWEIKNDGFKVIFSKDIPTIIKTKLKSDLDSFLQEQNISLEEIQFFILHPGGTKVIEAYEDVFHLTSGQTDSSKKILRQYGNMSSPTVLFVLKDFMEKAETPKGYGILLALGPGFSAETLLLRRM